MPRSQPALELTQVTDGTGRPIEDHLATEDPSCATISADLTPSTKSLAGLS